MRIKLDENIPATLASILSKLGHDVDTVLKQRLGGGDDSRDFSDIRGLSPGTHHGLLLLRLRDPGRNALARRIRASFETEDVHNWAGCVVVATDRKIRIRRKP